VTVIKRYFWGVGVGRGEAVLHKGHLEYVFLQAYTTKYKYSVICLHIYNEQVKFPVTGLVVA